MESHADREAVGLVALRGERQATDVERVEAGAGGGVGEHRARPVRQLDPDHRILGPVVARVGLTRGHQAEAVVGGGDRIAFGPVHGQPVAGP